MASIDSDDDHLTRLIDWELKLNKKSGIASFISVRNDVDDSGPPAHFNPVTDYVSSYVDLTREPTNGCDCFDCFGNSYCRCFIQANLEPNYLQGLLNVEPGDPIFECNKKCMCGPDCPNRVVQKGTNVRFQIFKTQDDRGWGLKTLVNINKGEFVIEYLGEVITNDEAERREYYLDHDDIYICDLNFNDDAEGQSYVVDGANFGNICRFINHSCSPNLETYPVYINICDLNLPRVALFAGRKIRRGEELTFNYRLCRETSDSKKALCLCGSRNCQKFLY